MHDNQSYFWPILLACIGGALVFVGLLLETLADKKRFKNIKSFRCWSCAKKIGEWAVVLGVLMETIDAGWTAYEIRKNDPMNQPVTSLRAILYLNIVGTNFDRGWINLGPNGSWSWSYNAQQNASGELEAFNHGSVAKLGCDSFEMHPFFMSSGTNFFSYSIGLSWPSPSPEVAQFETPPIAGHTTILVLQQPPPTVIELEKELTGLWVRVPGLATNGMSFTTQSSCVLMINGKTQIHFAIPTNILEYAYTFFPVALKEMQKK